MTEGVIFFGLTLIGPGRGAGTCHRMGVDVLIMSLDDILNEIETKRAPNKSTSKRKPRAKAGARPVRARGRGGHEHAPGMFRGVVKGSGVRKGGGMRSSRPVVVRECAGNEVQVDIKGGPWQPSA